MANYSLTINSKFQPFSFERYMQPIQIYANLYERQEAALDALDEKASKWEMLANMAGNEQSYKKYKSYADELKKKADELSTVGLTPQSRRELRELTNKYRTDVQPIEQAYNRWQELEKEQRVFSANNNFNVRYDNDYSTMRLDDLISNPNQSYTAIKGDDVMTKTAALAKQALQSIVNNPEISQARKGILLTKLQSGATLEQLNRALALGLQPGQTGDEAVDALLQVARTVDASYQSNKAYNKDWVWNNIAQGLYGGVGTTTYNFIDDPMALNPLQEYQLQRTKEQDQPVLMEDGSYYDPLKSMYFTKDEKGNRVYSTYSPGSQFNIPAETIKEGGYKDGQIVSGDESNPPSIVNVDKKTGNGKLTPLTQTAEDPNVFTDNKGHYYTRDGKSTTKPTGNNKATTYQPSKDPGGLVVASAAPIHWKAYDDSGDGFERKATSGYFWGVGHGKGEVHTTQEALNILERQEVMDIAREYVSNITGAPKEEVTPELVKDLTDNKLITLRRDRDWFSKNEYNVGIAGINKDGGFDNEDDKKLANNTYKQIMAKTTQHLGYQPNLQPNNTTQTPSGGGENPAASNAIPSN